MTGFVVSLNLARILLHRWTFGFNGTREKFVVEVCDEGQNVIVTEQRFSEPLQINGEL